MRTGKLAAMKKREAEKAIQKEMLKDLFKFVAMFTGLAAVMTAVLALFGVPFSWDLVAILLTLTIIYKAYIVPKYASIKEGLK